MIDRLLNIAAPTDNISSFKKFYYEVNNCKNSLVNKKVPKKEFESVVVASLKKKLPFIVMNILLLSFSNKVTTSVIIEFS